MPQYVINSIFTGTSKLDNKDDKFHTGATVSKANILNASDMNDKNILDTTDTENSDVDAVNMNKFGSKKTSRWNRPKIDLSLKDLEKVPTRRSKRISKLQKEKSQSQVKFYLFPTILQQCNNNANKYSI